MLYKKINILHEKTLKILCYGALFQSTKIKEGGLGNKLKYISSNFLYSTLYIIIIDLGTCGYYTIFISVILCPSSLENAVLSPDCLRRSGDSCSFSCVKGYAPSTKDELLCTTEGVWNNDATKLCLSKINII